MFKMHGSSFAFLPIWLLLTITEASKNYVVTVGKDSQLKFNPETLTAAVGDSITYQFFAKNHAVAQSSFDEPCQPLAGGLFSGFTPNPSTDTPSPTTFTITVNDTKPIWIYCPQTNGDHCQKGMVHAINAPSSGNTFDAYKSKAGTAPTSKSPADGLPIGGLRLLTVELALGGNLTFTPNNITELPRTVVQFNFNPKNHSVVQSSFQDPCHPLDKGFTSGFIPTTVSPSGAHFDIVVPDTKPIWFYCAQTTGSHCQSGMVGSINAPTSGNTLSAFQALAKKASTSTIPPQAPLGGVLSVNGTIITSLDGNVFEPDSSSLDPGAITDVPPPGTNMSAYIWNTAGGGQPDSYNWATGISDNATSFLQLLEFLDNILLAALIDGHARLSAGGQWAGVYPATIVDTIGTLAAQALVHRATATDTLQHYGRALAPTCSYTLPSGNVDEWLESALIMLLLEIGVLVDVVAATASTDAWLVPALATELGAKARMTAVVNMMQGHVAAAAPREALVPAQLAWNYAQHWTRDCQGPSPSVGLDKTWPGLEVVGIGKLGSTSRVGSVTFKLEGDWSKSNPGGLWVAWIAAWGTLRFSPVAADGSAPAPGELYGHVWAVLVNKGEGKVGDLVGITVAGPELVWVSQP